MNDTYTKCRNCVNFGTENCPESSLCFALNYKPFYKAKPKLKKKYRRAVFFIALTPIIVIAAPVAVLDATCAYIIDLTLNAKDWLEDKLRVYGFDPD